MASEPNAEPSLPASPLTLLDVLLLLLLLDPAGHHGQLGLQLGRGGVGAGKVVERLPGVLQRAHQPVLQVRAHPGQALLQLWKTITHRWSMEVRVFNIMPL